ncbi:hypothetical protein D3C75_994340 [compost metagenome]
MPPWKIMVKKMNSSMIRRPGKNFLDNAYASVIDTNRLKRVPITVITTEFLTEVRKVSAFSR